ncbi:hypothetical protein TcBrA4_0006650 [Trypanosoma cruzi]|nr:hypothetical protein TcBrA4_0006650 [Trypanosoma cruzi]
MVIFTCDFRWWCVCVWGPVPLLLCVFCAAVALVPPLSFCCGFVCLRAGCATVDNKPSQGEQRDGCLWSKGSTSDKGLASDKDGKNAKDRKEAWERIRQAIPREKTAEAKQRRIELFKKFDKNETGKLCYDEVYSGCLEVLKLDEFTPRVRDHHERAFDKARALGSKLENKGPRLWLNFWSSV